MSDKIKSDVSLGTTMPQGELRTAPDYAPESQANVSAASGASHPFALMPPLQKVLDVSVRGVQRVFKPTPAERLADHIADLQRHLRENGAYAISYHPRFRGGAPNATPDHLTATPYLEKLQQDLRAAAAARDAAAMADVGRRFNACIQYLQTTSEYEARVAALAATTSPILGEGLVPWQGYYEIESTPAWRPDGTLTPHDGEPIPRLTRETVPTQSVLPADHLNRQPLQQAYAQLSPDEKQSWDAAFKALNAPRGTWQELFVGGPDSDHHIAYDPRRGIGVESSATAADALAQLTAEREKMMATLDVMIAATKEHAPRPKPPTTEQQRVVTALAKGLEKEFGPICQIRADVATMEAVLKNEGEILKLIDQNFAGESSVFLSAHGAAKAALPELRRILGEADGALATAAGAVNAGHVDDARKFLRRAHAHFDHLFHSPARQAAQQIFEHREDFAATAETITGLSITVASMGLASIAEAGVVVGTATSSRLAPIAMNLGRGIQNFRLAEASATGAAEVNATAQAAGRVAQAAAFVDAEAFANQVVFGTPLPDDATFTIDTIHFGAMLMSLGKVLQGANRAADALKLGPAVKKLFGFAAEAGYFAGVWSPAEAITKAGILEGNWDLHHAAPHYTREAFLHQIGTLLALKAGNLLVKPITEEIHDWVRQAQQAQYVTRIQNRPPIVARPPAAVQAVVEDTVHEMPDNDFAADERFLFSFHRTARADLRQVRFIHGVDRPESPKILEKQYADMVRKLEEKKAFYFEDWQERGREIMEDLTLGDTDNKYHLIRIGQYRDDPTQPLYVLNGHHRLTTLARLAGEGKILLDWLTQIPVYYHPILAPDAVRPVQRGLEEIWAKIRQEDGTSLAKLLKTVSTQGVKETVVDPWNWSEIHNWYRVAKFALSDAELAELFNFYKTGEISEGQFRTFLQHQRLDHNDEPEVIADLAAFLWAEPRFRDLFWTITTPNMLSRLNDLLPRLHAEAPEQLQELFQRIWADEQSTMTSYEDVAKICAALRIDLPEYMRSEGLYTDPNIQKLDWVIADNPLNLPPHEHLRRVLEMPQPDELHKAAAVALYLDSLAERDPFPDFDTIDIFDHPLQTAQAIVDKGLTDVPRMLDRLETIFEGRDGTGQNITAPLPMGKFSVENPEYDFAVLRQRYPQTVAMCETLLEQRAQELGVPRNQVRVAVLGPGFNRPEVYIWLGLGASVVVAEASRVTLNYILAPMTEKIPPRLIFVDDAENIPPESADIVISIHPGSIQNNLIARGLKPGGIMVLQSDNARHIDSIKTAPDLTVLLKKPVDGDRYFMPSTFVQPSQLVVKKDPSKFFSYSKLVIARKENTSSSTSLGGPPPLMIAMAWPGVGPAIVEGARAVWETTRQAAVRSSDYVRGLRQMGGPVLMVVPMQSAASCETKISAAVERQARQIDREYLRSQRQHSVLLDEEKADQALRVAVAKIVAKRDPQLFTATLPGQRIGSYHIISEADRVVVAKIIAAQDGEIISRHIHTFGITDQAALVEIAKIAAAQNGRATSAHIQNYFHGLMPMADRIAIAKIAAAQDAEGLIANIRKYEITDHTGLAEIAAEAWAASPSLDTLQDIYRHFDLLAPIFFRLNPPAVYLRRPVSWNQWQNELPPDVAKAIYADTQRRDVGVSLFLQFLKHHYTDPNRLTRLAGSGPKAVSRFLLADALGFKAELFDPDLKYSERALGDFYEFALQLQQGLDGPALKGVKLDASLFADKSLKHLLRFMHAANRLKGIMGSAARTEWPAFVAEKMGGRIKWGTLDRVTPRLESRFLEIFRERFRLGKMPITMGQISALEKRWGNLEVFYTLVARYSGKSAWQKEVPFLQKIMGAVLEDRFHEAKYHGFKGDVEDRAMAAAQLRMLKDEAAREGWKGNCSQIGIFRSGGEAGLRSEADLLQDSKEILRSQVMSHLSEMPGQADVNGKRVTEIRQAIEKDPKAAIKTFKTEHATLTRALFHLLGAAETRSRYQELLGLIKGNMDLLGLAPQLQSDVRSLDAALRYTDTGKDAILFTTTTDDPKLLLMTGDLVDCSSCQNYRTGSHIETLLGYVADANVKLMLSFALTPKDFSSVKDYEKARDLVAAGDAKVEFLPAQRQLKIGDMTIDLPRAIKRRIIKLGATKSGEAGLQMEREYLQNHFAEGGMTQQIADVHQQLAEAAGAVTDQKIKIPRSRNPGGVYSDAATGIMTGAYSIHPSKKEKSVLPVAPAHAIGLADPVQRVAGPGGGGRFGDGFGGPLMIAMAWPKVGEGIIEGARAVWVKAREILGRAKLFAQPATSNALEEGDVVNRINPFAVFLPHRTAHVDLRSLQFVHSLDGPKAAHLITEKLVEMRWALNDFKRRYTDDWQKRGDEIVAALTAGDKSSKADQIRVGQLHDDPTEPLYLLNGHRRLTTLALLATNGEIPVEWLTRIPVWYSTTLSPDAVDPINLGTRRIWDEVTVDGLKPAKVLDDLKAKFPRLRKTAVDLWDWEATANGAAVRTWPMMNLELNHLMDLHHKGQLSDDHFMTIVHHQAALKEHFKIVPQEFTEYLYSHPKFRPLFWEMMSISSLSTRGPSFIRQVYADAPDRIEAAMRSEWEGDQFDGKVLGGIRQISFVLGKELPVYVRSEDLYHDANLTKQRWVIEYNPAGLHPAEHLRRVLHMRVKNKEMYERALIFYLITLRNQGLVSQEPYEIEHNPVRTAKRFIRESTRGAAAHPKVTIASSSDLGGGDGFGGPLMIAMAWPGMLKGIQGGLTAIVKGARTLFGGAQANAPTNSPQDSNLSQLLAENHYPENKQGELIQALRDLGISEDKALALLRSIADSVQDRRTVSGAFMYIPPALKALINSGLNIEAAGRYLQEVAAQAIVSVGYAYRFLPDAIENLKKSGLGDKAALRHLMGIVRRVGIRTGSQYENFLRAFAALVRSGLEEKDVFSYLQELDRRVGGTEPASSKAFSQLARLLPVLTSSQEFNPQEARDLIMDIARVMGPLASDVLPHVPWMPRQVATPLKAQYLTLLGRLSPYNSRGVTQLIWKFSHKHSTDISPEVYERYMALAARVFDIHPRIGMNVLEGIFGAIESGDLSKDEAPDEQQILDFVNKAHSFHPVLYRDFRERGDVVFDELDAMARKILADEISAADLRAFIRTHGQEGHPYLLAVIQRASPTSGASFVKLSDQEALLRARISAGDLREHIPTAWRNRVEQFELEQGEWRLKDGRSPDPNGKIGALIQALKEASLPVSAETRQTLEDQFKSALDLFLAAESADRGRYRDQAAAALLRWASADEDIRSRLAMIDDIHHTTLGLLNEILLDKDMVPRLLPESVENKTEIIKRLLAPELKAIRKSLQRYHYDRNIDNFRVGLRALKGPAIGLYGLTAGVCTAADDTIWKSPNFRPLAITDESDHRIVGYVQTVEVKQRGKKYLTLPGIDPSPEFMSTVKAREFYPKLMAAVAAYAEADGYEGVLIPTDKNIHSNRGDIQTEIRRANYRTLTLDKEVQWNVDPQPYPFKEVFVAWERPHGAHP